MALRHETHGLTHGMILPIDTALQSPAFFLDVNGVFLPHFHHCLFLIIQQKIGDTVFRVSYLYVTSLS